MFEARHQRARDVIQRAIRNTISSQVHIHTTIRKLHFTVPRKPIGNHCQSLVPLHVAGTLEEFIKDRIDNML